MRRSSSLTRALSHVTLLLQLLLPTVVSLADARLERDAMSARAYSHVEATTGKDCARAHKADCALCQHLTTPIAKSAKAEPPIYAGRSERPAVAFGVSRPSAHPTARLSTAHHWCASNGLWIPTPRSRTA